MSPQLRTSNGLSAFTRPTLDRVARLILEHARPIFADYPPGNLEPYWSYFAH